MVRTKGWAAGGGVEEVPAQQRSRSADGALCQHQSTHDCWLMAASRGRGSNARLKPACGRPLHTRRIARRIKIAELDRVAGAMAQGRGGTREVVETAFALEARQLTPDSSL